MPRIAKAPLATPTTPTVVAVAVSAALSLIVILAHLPRQFGYACDLTN